MEKHLVMVGIFFELKTSFILHIPAKISKTMLEKEQPIGICDLCFEPILEDQWYTVEGKIRLHCSTKCRNTANSRAGREILRQRMLEQMAAGTWIRPDLIKKPSPEAVSRGISRRRKQEVAAGTWRNPSKSDEARKKLSRPRVHGDNPTLKSALSKLTAGVASADLTNEEAEEHRAYRRRLHANRKDEINRQSRQRRADMTPEEREVQRAKWRASSKRNRDKKRKGTKPRSRKLLNKEQIVELQNRRQQGTTAKELMQDYRLSRSSTYRYLKECT